MNRQGYIPLTCEFLEHKKKWGKHAKHINPLD